MDKEVGADPALVNQAATHLGPTGFDPGELRQFNYEQGTPTKTSAYVSEQHVWFRCGAHGWTALGHRCPKCAA